ncbi:MAG: PhoH family protein [Candidatus Woesearchaeota archaeon]
MKDLKKIVRDIVDKHKYNSVKVLDASAFLEAPSLIFDKKSFTKEDKKTLVIGSQTAFDHLYFKTNGNRVSPRHRENFEELSDLRTKLNYDGAHSVLGKNKGFLTLPSAVDSNGPLNTDKYSQEFQKIAKDLGGELKELDTDYEFVCVDKHILANLKSLGVPADGWKDVGLTSLTSLYYGWSEITTIDPSYINNFEKKQVQKAINLVTSNDEREALGNLFSKLKSKGKLKTKDVVDFHKHDFKPNEILFLNKDRETANLRYDSKQDALIYFNYNNKLNEIFNGNKQGFYGISPLNKYQEAEFELLMNTDLNIIYGAAGTGKSLIPLALGVHALMMPIKTNKKGLNIDIRKKFFSNYNPATSPNPLDYEKLIDKLSIYRPTTTLDEDDLGFLPGSLNEKMFQYALPIKENIEIILSAAHKKQERDQDRVDKLMQGDQIEVVSALYLRGKSFHNSFIMLDEAQNFSQSTLKTAFTRATDSCRITLTGDPSQTDVSGQEVYYNPLTKLINSESNYMKDNKGILFLPPIANVRGALSREYL